MSNTLSANQKLETNDQLTSTNGHYRLIMQPDGNLVLYAGNHALWATGTDGSDGKYAIMQSDGNFVLYDSTNDALWASVTDGEVDAYIILQDDGNLVIYSRKVAWASGTDNG